MSVGQSVWKVDQKPQRLMYSKLDSEQDLAEMICNDMGILNEPMDACSTPSYDSLQ